MKSLKDLKEDIIQKDYKNFYVFCGSDHGLIRHYIEEISKHYTEVINLFAIKDIISSSRRGLFATSRLYVVYNDVEFSKAKPEYIQTLLNRLGSDSVIVVYEEEVPNSPLFTDFNEHITLFTEVNTNIAMEFVSDLLSLTISSKEDICFNCTNNYGKILLEADKIKSYADERSISHQSAYEELAIQGQLIQEYPVFNCNIIIDEILQGQLSNLGYWYKLITEKYAEDFWRSLTSIYNSFLIAYLVKRYGKWEGSNRAYDYRLPWGRTKAIREFSIPYDAETLLNTIHSICEIDLKVKTGKLSQAKIFDYFITQII